MLVLRSLVSYGFCEVRVVRFLDGWKVKMKVMGGWVLGWDEVFVGFIF